MGSESNFLAEANRGEDRETPGRCIAGTAEKDSAANLQKCTLTQFTKHPAFPEGRTTRLSGLGRV